MTAQGLRVRPAGGGDAHERLDRQEAIFGWREGELLARHPGRIIIVCGGEVLASDSCDEALSWAPAAPDAQQRLFGQLRAVRKRVQACRAC